MKIQKSAVYILGAGATLGAYDNSKQKDKPTIFPPTDINFFEVARQIRGRGTGVLADKVISNVYERYQRTYDVSLEAYYRDIETRGEIVRFAKTGHRLKDWDKRKEDLDELIRRVIIQTTCKEKNKATTYAPIVSEVLSRTLKTLDKGDNIVTFNYDTLIEESLEKGASWSPRDGYGVSVGGVRGDWCRLWTQRHQPEGNVSSFQIFKMHGSINWHSKLGSGVKLQHDAYMVRRDTSGKKPARREVLFLAPSYHKTIDVNPYKRIWQGARKALEEAKTFVIIGYSLPENDFLAQALFAEVVRHRRVSKNYIRQIIICNPNAAVRTRFLELLQPATNQATKVLFLKNIEEFVDRV